MQRICVVGTTGSGKTTLARRVAERIGARHVELDGLHWGPDWTPWPLAQFRQDVAKVVGGDRWVVDGNYSGVRDLVWSRADTLLWLDYPAVVVLARLSRRTARRVLTREVLWNGNRERWPTQIVGRDSVFLCAMRTHWTRRRKYRRLLGSSQYAHLQLVRLTSPRDADRWLGRMPGALVPGEGLGAS